MTQDQLDNLCNLHATLYVYQERIDRLLRDLGDVLQSAGVHNVPLHRRGAVVAHDAGRADTSSPTCRPRPRTA